MLEKHDSSCYKFICCVRDRNLCIERTTQQYDRCFKAKCPNDFSEISGQPETVGLDKTIVEQLRIKGEMSGHCVKIPLFALTKA